MAGHESMRTRMMIRLIFRRIRMQIIGAYPRCLNDYVDDSSSSRQITWRYPQNYPPRIVQESVLHFFSSFVESKELLKIS